VQRKINIVDVPEKSFVQKCIDACSYSICHGRLSFEYIAFRNGLEREKIEAEEEQGIIFLSTFFDFDPSLEEGKKIKIGKWQKKTRR
jgi:hypothetical protein